MTKQQRYISIGVLIVLVIAIGWTLLPFKFAGTLSCGPPILGGNPGEFSDEGKSLIVPERDCHNAARSRLTVAAVGALMAVIAGAVALAFQPVSRHCLAGDHDDCVDWWPAALGPLGHSLGCQCDCH